VDGERVGVHPRPESPRRELTGLQAPAKINLALHVHDLDPGTGYHEIETVLLTLELSDELTLRRTASGGVSIVVRGGEPCASEENLAYRAARGFLADDPELGVRIELTKRIPSGAGLGGGSSDAGTVLRAMESLFPGVRTPAELVGIASSLGADVPFFLLDAPMAFGEGRGDRLTELPAPPARPVLVALPHARVATPAAYRALDEARSKGGPGTGPVRAGAEGRRTAERTLPSLRDPAIDWRRWEALSAVAHNDFEDVVFQDLPELPVVIGHLRDAGADIALLSGSGAAVFGVFASERAALAAKEALEGLPQVEWVCLTRSGTRAHPEPGTRAHREPDARAPAPREE
jgi:4-diphosphocytidyl-2-C-methyl-D-erythritol kinase